MSSVSSASGLHRAKHRTWIQFSQILWMCGCVSGNAEDQNGPHLRTESPRSLPAQPSFKYQ